MIASAPRGAAWAAARASAALLAGLLAVAGAGASARAEATAEGVVTVRFDGPSAAPLATFVLDAPPRAVIDLPGGGWRAEGGAPIARGLRDGLAAPGRGRLVIDLARPAVPRALLRADRLEIRLVPAPQEAFAAAAGWPEGLAPPAAAPGRPLRVLVDPGHGGVDPGASHGALLEKDVALRVGLALAEALEAAGHEALLTRADDRTLRLSERVATAAALRPDALISIHADAAPQAGLSGGSVYTLSARASDAMAAAMARRENAGEDPFAGAGDEAAALLAEIAALRAPARSAALGRALVAGLSEVGPTLPASPLRAAAFAVLRVPGAPAALVELGYLSNAADRERLADPAWGERAARALADAVTAWAAGLAAAAAE